MEAKEGCLDLMEWQTKRPGCAVKHHKVIKKVDYFLSLSHLVLCTNHEIKLASIITYVIAAIKGLSVFPPS